MEKKYQKKKYPSLKEKLKVEVKSKMTELGLWTEDLESDIPTFWDSFNNFVVFNRKFFSNHCWKEAGNQVWQCVSEVFSGKSIAFLGNIQNDNFRSPNATVVYGDSSWVEYTDNGIFYTWNLQFTMFCSGNASERHRIASLDCRNKVVVDMFAGIGYFTLPYLVHAQAEHVIACEWNPVSVEALKLNLTRNKVAEKCVILEGDVRVQSLRDVADHVNLGLIPSCEQYWATAADTLKASGGVLHVHGNVTSVKTGQELTIKCSKCVDFLSEMSMHTSFSEKQNLVDFSITVDLEKAEKKAQKCSSTVVKWKKLEWFVWGVHVSHSFCELLSTSKKTGWTVTPNFIHKVKAYAPHIDHLVIDVCCQRYEVDQL